MKSSTKKAIIAIALAVAVVTLMLVVIFDSGPDIGALDCQVQLCDL